MKSNADIDRIIDRFSSAWPPGRKDFRTAGDQSWKTYATTLRDLVAARQPALVEKQIHHENRQVRALVARALGYLAHERSVPVLAELLEEDSWATTRLLAADALGMIHTENAAAVLTEARDKEENDDVKLHIGVALSRESGLENGALEDLLAIKAERLDSARIGEPAVGFSLLDGNGADVDLIRYRNTRAVALYFLYGDG